MEEGKPLPLLLVNKLDNKQATHTAKAASEIQKQAQSHRSKTQL